MDDLLREAIADAKSVRETALANAKIALEEAFTPRLQSMLSKKIQSEMEDSDEEMDADEMRDSEEGMHDKEEGMHDKEEEMDAEEMRDSEEICSFITACTIFWVLGWSTPRINKLSTEVFNTDRPDFIEDERPDS